MASEGISLLKQAAQELRAGRGVVEAVVLSTTGSAPRPAGARMLLLSDGGFAGTVGGGAAELSCQEACREVWSGSPAVLRTYDQASTGMVCGGSQLVGVRRLRSADAAAIDEALARLGAGGSCRLVVDWAAPVPVASCVPVAPSPGEQAAYEAGRFTEPLRAPERAIVFGGGHVGRSLVPLLAGVGFSVTLFDDRPEVARPELFPDADLVLCGDYAGLSGRVDIGVDDYVCVMTHGHLADEEVVAQALLAHPRYLGCMGSRRKRAVMIDALVRRGCPPEGAESVELPIGLALGGVTPAEIALSVAARLVQVRAGR